MAAKHGQQAAQQIMKAYGSPIPDQQPTTQNQQQQQGQQNASSGVPDTSKGERRQDNPKTGAWRILDAQGNVVRQGGG